MTFWHVLAGSSKFRLEFEVGSGFFDVLEVMHFLRASQLLFVVFEVLCNLFYLSFRRAGTKSSNLESIVTLSTATGVSFVLLC